MFLQLFPRGKRVGTLMHAINQNPPAAPESSCREPLLPLSCSVASRFCTLLVFVAWADLLASPDRLGWSVVRECLLDVDHLLSLGILANVNQRFMKRQSTNTSESC